MKRIDSGRKRNSTVITLDQDSTTTLANASPKFHFLDGSDSYDLEGIPVMGCMITS